MHIIIVMWGGGAAETDLHECRPLGKLFSEIYPCAKHMFC